MEKNNKKKATVATIEREFKKNIDELAHAIIEEERDAFESDLEPFEAYAQRVKAQFHKDAGEFKKRFTNGYDVLLNEIINEGEVVTDEEPPPPGAIIL